MGQVLIKESFNKRKFYFYHHKFIEIRYMLYISILYLYTK